MIARQSAQPEFWEPNFGIGPPAIQTDSGVTASSGYIKRRGARKLNAYARVDNLFDRDYAGSVIVNEANGRYYEPVPGRNAGVGVGATYRF